MRTKPEPTCIVCGRAVRDDLKGHVDPARDASPGGHRPLAYDAADPYRDSMMTTGVPLRSSTGIVGPRSLGTTTVVPKDDPLDPANRMQPRYVEDVGAIAADLGPGNRTTLRYDRGGLHYKGTFRPRR